MPRLASLAVALAGILLATPARAQAVGDDCGTLAGKYQSYVTTADTLITDLVGSTLKGGGGPGVLERLGIDVQGLSPEQAARKGALAALSPPAQNAILIYLLRANTAMQELIWKGCKPPS